MSSATIIQEVQRISPRHTIRNWAIGMIGFIILVGWVRPTLSQEVCESYDVTGSNGSAAEEECVVPLPPSRLRPTFSEEDERGLQERSLADSFLGDALSGMADPLGGGSSVGGELETDGSLVELTPGDRGLTLEPGFDPTNVIIPLDAVRK